MKESRGPAARIIKLISFFSNHPQKDFSLQELQSQLGISGATLLRDLEVLLEQGYLLRKKARRYQSNCLFQRMLPFGQNFSNKLDRILRSLADSRALAAELLLVQANHLFWARKEEGQNQEISINAFPGFTRSLYELDAPSRLFLAQRGQNYIEASMDKQAFYLSRPDYKKISWEQARTIIAKTDLSAVAYDPEGNSNGVRRFAVLIKSEKITQPLIITLAEAALARNNHQEHINRVRHQLLKAKNELEDFYEDYHD